MDCDTCAYFQWDDEEEDFICEADVDEDDLARMMQEPSFRRHSRCPYWVKDDEYAVVRHQAF